MEFRHLRYFVTVAEEGSFTRAAERLQMAQPPLSTQIRQLETLLGVQLFDRSRRAIRMTAAGQALLPDARRLLAERDRSVAMVRRTGTGKVGRLAVGFIPSATNGVLPTVLRHYRREFPAVELTLRELAPDALIAGVHDRSLDIAFLYRPLTDASLEHRVVEREPLVAALPTGHPLAGGGTVDVGRLADQPFVLPARHELPGLHGRIVDLCREHGFAPRVAQGDVWLVQTLVALVAAGIGIALVPASAHHLHPAGVEYLPLRSATEQLELIAAWRHETPSQVLAGFLAAVESPRGRPHGGR